MAISADRGFRIWLCVTILSLLVAAIVFTLYTSNIWEDYLITLRFSQNLVDGNGLVYHVGERVHGFTSVINTLLPALFLWLGDVENYEGALAGYRVFSILALLGGTTVLFYSLWRENRLGSAGRWLLTVLLALDFKLVAFTCNGMEAGFLVGFMMAAIAVGLRGVRNYWLPSGLIWAGLLYTRPDTPLMLAGVAGLALSVHREDWKSELHGLVKASLVCALLYLPWFLWTWSYYGSPIPHTIVAKAAYGAAQEVDPWIIKFLKLWSALPTMACKVYLPPYPSLTEYWPIGVVASLLATGLAALSWLRSSADRATRALSVLLACYLLYFSIQEQNRQAYPWYFPPATFLASLILARLAAENHHRSILRPAFIAIPVSLALLSTNWANGAFSIRVQQREVEEGVRKQIGLWLKENVPNGESVFLEPLGYIGYFSRAHMLDYPGLVSPRSVSAVKATTGNIAAVAAFLRPEWLVLRPTEKDAIFAHPGVSDAYELAAVRDRRKVIAAYGSFEGRNYAFSDAAFLIYRRKATPGTAAADGERPHRP